MGYDIVLIEVRVSRLRFMCCRGLEEEGEEYDVEGISWVSLRCYFVVGVGFWCFYCFMDGGGYTGKVGGVFLFFYAVFFWFYLLG